MTTQLTYNHIDRTGLNQDEVLSRAVVLRRQMNRRFGPDAVSLQDAIDSTIDALIEHAQG